MGRSRRDQTILPISQATRPVQALILLGGAGSFWTTIPGMAALGALLVLGMVVFSGPGAAQYSHQSDPAQFNSLFLPAVEHDQYGDPLAIPHAEWQFVVPGMTPAGHRGPVSAGFLFGPGVGVNDDPLCDGTLWGDPDDWSHSHGGVQSCGGPCTVLEERWAKCDAQPPGTPLGPLQFRDAFVYTQTDSMCTACAQAPMLYEITQFGPSTGLRDGGPSQHSGPILRELLVHNSGGQLMVFGHDPIYEVPNPGRIRVTGWGWDGQVYPLAEWDPPTAPTANLPVAATWPTGVDLQYLVVDGTVDVTSWYMGDLQLNAVPEPDSWTMLCSGMALIWRLRRARH